MNPENHQIIALLREMAIMCYCKHPNILELKGIYFHPTEMYISNFYKDNENQKIFGMTSIYCAPEIKFSNLSLLTPKADIFSFGMLIIFTEIKFIRILYEIATFREAFASFMSLQF